MKSLIKAVAIAAILAAPVVSFAQQSNQPLTRAEVRQQLIELEQAGYNPARANDYDYPADIQAAEARVAAQKAGGAQATAYGPAMNASSQSGSPATAAAGTKPIFFGQ
jgi:hypothetical protein